MARSTVRTRVTSFDATGPIRSRADVVAGEEPLEIRLDGDEFTVAMRTPGHDVDLVFGLLLAEGIIVEADDIREVDFSTGLDPDGRRNFNVAGVRLAPHAALRAAARTQRAVYTSSACGICGTSAIEGVEKTSAHPLPPLEPLVTPATLLALPDALRSQQTAFDKTGGIHGAGLFRILPGQRNDSATQTPVEGDVADEGGAAAPHSASEAGRTATRGTSAGRAAKTHGGTDVTPAGVQLLVSAEDVGRHNAVDKVIGYALRNGMLPLDDVVLQVSSRASYELVQKAAMVGIPVLSAVSAPSSAAVELGRELGVTVVGFNRGKKFNAYSAIERVRA